jgi:putative redox protein
MTTPTTSSSASTASAAAGPVISRTEVTWLGDRLFDAGPIGRQHRIDAGAKEAPGPVETLLSAVATCSGIDLIDILAKRRTPIERLGISVVAERRPEFPRRVQRLEIEYRIDGAGIDREQAERAMQLSFEKYCSVAASLAPDIIVEAKLTLNGESYPASRQKVWAPTI